MNRRILSFLLPAALSLALSSCGEVKQVVYFQDAADGGKIEMPQCEPITVQPSDQLSILVNSKDPELSAVFNLPVITHQYGSSQPGWEGSSTTNQVAAYYVDSNGNIDLPVIGTIHVAGKTRDEIAAEIKTLILDSKFINDPVVTVEFANMYVSVFGDIAHPGRIKIDKDRMTVLDVLAKAGDLNVTGLRDIKLFREENGVQQCYVIDLNNAEALFKSPVYRVKQDDVIYVIPNDMKARSSTVNGNNLLSTSFWLSLGSLATSVAALIVNIGVISK